MVTINLDRRVLKVVLGLLVLVGTFGIAIVIGQRLSPVATVPAPSVATTPLANPNPPAAPNPGLVAQPQPVIGFTPGADATLAAEPRLEIADALKRLGQPDAVFIDVRSKPVYDGGHIQGAINVPVAEIATRAAELPKDKDLILYCA